MGVVKLTPDTANFCDAIVTANITALMQCTEVLVPCCAQQAGCVQALIIMHAAIDAGIPDDGILV